MIVLPRNFTKLGWHHMMIARNGNVAIYRRSKETGPAHFEVVRIKSHNGFPLPTGETTAPGEYYPSGTSWGRDGFTYNTQEDASIKYEAMVKSDALPKVKKGKLP